MGGRAGVWVCGAFAGGREVGRGEQKVCSFGQGRCMQQSREWQQTPCVETAWQAPPAPTPPWQHPHARGDAHQYQLGQGQSRLVHSCGHGILVNLGWRQHGRHRLHRQVGGGGSGGTSVERSRVGVCCGIGLAGLAGQLGLRPRQWGCRPCLDAVLWLQPRERQGQWQQAAARGRGWAG